ncbi:HAMP domain-containing histidine kinase [Salinirubellus salinus]|uniref:histidine kinase n=1 Tax=Salinirubellus salinus TaxID=1364945 RepID=A0A9E7U8R3_9EURY|nr:HAMP domain-containing sensor histidine kinase [Salinirubellus salinus]UWM55111.1 HAMP domain-containing histidine kinase [Salinirubellus salinus]
MTTPPTHLPGAAPPDAGDETETCEQTHRRAERLQRRVDRLTECSEVFVHDIRTPVSVAAGRIALAREADDDDEHLEAAADALARVGGMLERWRTLLRAEERARWERLDFEALVRSVWRDLATPRDDLLVEGTLEFRGDPDAVDRLLMNLVSNALDHAGPDVTVWAGSIDEDGFYVEDDGAGIPPSEREAVFDPGHSSGGDGHGFGLTSVEHVADAHDWAVLVDEGREGGARFEVRDVEVV